MIGIHCLFKIDVQSVLITDYQQGEENGGFSTVNVCFDRSHRLATTSGRKCRLVPGQPTTIEFGESLTLLTSLQRDPRSGNYKEKLAKLIVRSKSSLSTPGGTGFRGLGLASLPLHRLVADFQSQQFNIPLTNNAQAVGRINVVISSKFVGEIPSDDVSDNEVGPEVGVEVADFEDHRLPTGESKRSSFADDIIGDTPPSNSAMRACEAALQAALASNKTIVRKNEEITAEIDMLRRKHEQVVDELRQQRELVVMLRTQQQGTGISGFGAQSGGTLGGKKVSGLLEQELELCKEKLLSQETKLKQAAEFVNFQEEQIQNLKDDIEDMREQAAIASGKFDPKPGSGSDVSMSTKLRNELLEQKELVEKYLTQIQDGASYVQHLQEQLDQAHDDVTRLRSQLNGDDDDSDSGLGRISNVTALQKELALKKEKIDKAAAYVKYQDNIISELTIEVEELKGNRADDSDRGDNVVMLRTRIEELENRLAQGATYCEFVQSQLDAATAEVESSKQAMTDLQQRCQLSEETIDILREQIRNGSGNSAAAQQEMLRELEQAQRLCAAYQVQMQRGSEYVDELKTELLSAQKRLVRLEMLQASNKTRSSTGGYDTNAERMSTLENELMAVFAELDKTRAKLASGGATQNEVQFYKSQNETYLMKLQQGADRVDALQRKLLEVEGELARANSRQRGGGAGEAVAVRSSVVPADHVVQELIEYKMKFAAAATDVDHERRKGQDAVLKLQAAGRRIAALEAGLMRAQEAADEKPKGMFSFFTGSNNSSSSSSVTGGSGLRPRSSSQVSAAESAHGSVAGSVAASESGYRPGMRGSPHRYGPSLGPGRGYPGGHSGGGIPGRGGGGGGSGGYVPGPGSGPSPFLSPALGGRPGPGGGMGPGRGIGNSQLQPGRPMMMMQRPMAGGQGSMQQQAIR